MTKKELLKKLERFDDNAEIVFDDDMDRCYFDVADDIDTYVCLKPVAAKYIVEYDGEKYGVGDICRLLPKAEVNAYPTEYACAVANVERYVKVKRPNLLNDDNKKFLLRCASILGCKLTVSDMVDIVEKPNPDSYIGLAQFVYRAITKESGRYVEEVPDLLMMLNNTDIPRILINSSYVSDDLAAYFSEKGKDPGISIYLMLCLWKWEILDIEEGDYCIGSVEINDGPFVGVYSKYEGAPLCPCGLVDENEYFLMCCCTLMDTVYTVDLAKDIVAGSDSVCKELRDAESILCKILYGDKCTKEILAETCHEMTGTPVEDIMKAIANDSGVAGKLQDAMSAHTEYAGLYAYVFACMYYWEVLHLYRGKQRIGIIRTSKGDFVELYRNDNIEETWQRKDMALKTVKSMIGEDFTTQMDD